MVVSVVVVLLPSGGLVVVVELSVRVSVEVGAGVVVVGTTTVVFVAGALGWRSWITVVLDVGVTTTSGC